jgi:hypothetical protein
MFDTLHVRCHSMNDETAAAAHEMGKLIAENSRLRMALSRARRVPHWWMLALLTAMLASMLGGCTLNKSIPKASIRYDRKIGALIIESAKDVVLTNVTLRVEGTNVTLEIGGYVARNNTDLILATVKAQQQQIDAMRGGLADLVKAGVEGMTPGK